MASPVLGIISLVLIALGIATAALIASFVVWAVRARARRGH